VSLVAVFCFPDSKHPEKVPIWDKRNNEKNSGIPLANKRKVAGDPATFLSMFMG